MNELIDRPPPTQQWILDLGFRRWSDGFKTYSTAYCKTLGTVERLDDSENPRPCQLILWHNGLRNPGDGKVHYSFETKCYQQMEGYIVELIHRAMSEEDFKKLFPSIEEDALKFYGLS